MPPLARPPCDRSHADRPNTVNSGRTRENLRDRTLPRLTERSVASNPPTHRALALLAAVRRVLVRQLRPLRLWLVRGGQQLLRPLSNLGLCSIVSLHRARPVLNQRADLVDRPRNLG